MTHAARAPDSHKSKKFNAPTMLDISPDAFVHPMACITESSQGSLISIGARSRIDAFVRIQPAGGPGDLRIGADCYINAGTAMFTGNGIKMGNGVLVAPNCTFSPLNHAYERRDMTIKAQRFTPSKGGIVVEDDVWIGANCVILDGAYICAGVVIAAGSIVRGRLEPYGVYAGSPLQLIKTRTKTAATP